MNKLELVLEAIDRASGPISKVDRAIDGLERNTRRSSGVMGRLGDVGGRAMRAIGTAAKLGAVAGVTALTAAIGGSIREAIRFQDLWSDANKTLGFTKAEMPAFKEAVNELSTRIPIARDQIVEMTGAAGRLGIKGKEALIGFVEVSAKAATAFEVGPTQMAQIFGNLRETLGYSTAQLELWADKVNWLGNNTAASEADIATYASAVQGIAREAGLAEDATLALGAAMIASGRAPEVATTGLRAFLRTMQKGWGDLSKAQKSGVTQFWDNLTPPQALEKAEAFQNQIQTMMLTDAEGAIRMVSEKIASLPEHMRGAFVSSYFGEEAGRALGPLLSNAEALEKALARIESFGGNKAAGALREEFAGATDDVLDNWAKLKNAFSVQAEKSGIPLLDPINDALKTTIGIMQTLGERITIFDRVRQSLKGFADGLGLDQLAGAGDAFRAIFDPIKKFLVGSADAELKIGLMGEIFDRAKTAGAALRPVLDRVGSALSAVWETLQSFGTGVSEIAVTIASGFTDHLGPIGDRIGALVDVMSGNVDRMVGFATSIGATIRDAFGGEGGIGALIGDLGGSAIEAGIALYTRFQAALGGVLDTLEGFARFAGNTLLSYFQGYFAGLTPYLEPMAEKLRSIWDRIGPILDNFGRIGTAIGAMFTAVGANEGAMSAIETFGRVIGGLAGIVGNVVLTGIEGLLRWIEAITGAMAALYAGDWQGAKASIDGFLSWVGGIALPEISIDLSGLTAAFDGVVGVIQAAWAEIKALFDTIAQAAAGVGDAIAAAISGGDSSDAGRLIGEASEGWGQWDFGIQQIERYRQGLIDLDQLNGELRPFEADGGLVTPYQNQVRRTLNMLDELIAAQNQVAGAPVAANDNAVPPVALPAMPSTVEIEAVTAQVQALDSDIAGVTAAANALPGIVQAAMARVVAAATLNLFDKGASMMDTLAAGMRSRAQAAIAEMQRLAQTLRDHLPSSPAKIGPLSDIHRLKFGETIAGSIRSGAAVKAMAALSADVMAAGAPNPRRFGVVSGPSRRATGVPTPRERPDLFRQAAGTGGGGSASPSGAGGITVHAPLTVSNVRFGTEGDKAEFETLLRRHSRQVAEAVDTETRRRSRLRF